MRKVISLVLFMILIGMPMVSANGIADGIDITNKKEDIHNMWGIVPSYPMKDRRERDNYLYADKNFPVCGVDTATVYFMDVKSCTYYIDNGVAYLSCIVYAGGGGADKNGNPAKVSPNTYRFSTYKTSNGRVIRFLSCVVGRTGENISAKEYKYDNGFLLGLFWRIAGVTDLSKYLD